ncbi:heat shock proteinB1 associated protein 1 [Trichuris trichiura]|uniref:Heat shock proteinB1 associated protein 1 n=1 Tax=Trichuris trichiura TaxID=36087 RepID=A0A077Z494_TRITR|nr:heat shock proteinB1 associated protein 1 [Trichuris trichiura]
MAHYDFIDHESTANAKKSPSLVATKKQKSEAPHPVDQLARRCEKLRNQLERLRSSLNEETVSGNGEQPTTVWDAEKNDVSVSREEVDLLSLPTVRPCLHGQWGCPGFRHDPVERYRLYAEEWKKFPIPGEKKHQSVRWDVREKMLRPHFRFLRLPNPLWQYCACLFFLSLAAYDCFILTAMSDVPCEPFVLKGMIENWQARKWTFCSVPGLLEDYVFGIRMGLRQYDEPGKILYETLCAQAHANAKQFKAWCNGFTEEKDVGELSRFPKEKYWAYVDYEYMFDCFDHSHLEDVDWNIFSLPYNGRESTFWMGTSGSFTACHYDTYGFNVVAQLCGKKRWILFPPEDSDLLKGSHLPFEESSVYSGCDLFHPPVYLRFSHPRLVTLEPGDILFVPPRWWHFVQCIEDSISVNSWIAVSSDRESRMDEAVTRACIAILKPIIDEGLIIEKDINTESSLKILSVCAANATSGIGPTDEHLFTFLDRFTCRGNAVPQVTYEELCKIVEHSGCTAKHGTEIATIEVGDVLSAILSPPVIERIRKQLFKTFR